MKRPSAVLALTVVMVGLLLGLALPALATPVVAPITVGPCFVAGEPEPPGLTANAALVIDSETGAVLYSKNADERLPMASTTKIMTAIIVLESLPLDEKVMVSRKAHFQSGSVVGLQAQEVATVEQLLYGLLVFSGNDAAVALAEKTAGSETKFVAKMNERATAMGLTNTHFTNSSGLNHKDHYSSCTDLATMSRYAMQNATFRQMVDTAEYDFPHPTRPTPRELKNSNALLTQYDWADGIKTGSTPWAGYCVVASGTREGVSLIVVLLGAVDDATRWKETIALFQYGFGLCPKTALAEPGRLVARAALGDPLGLSVGLVPQETLAVRLWRGDEVKGTVTLSPDTAPPIDAGDRLGSVEFSLDGVSLGSVDLFAQHAVHVPAIRDVVRDARNWYLAEFVLTERDGRVPR